MSDNCRDLFFTETTATALGTYSAYIGDGVNTTYNITHNLNSEKVTYSLRDVQTDVLGYAQVNVTGPDTVTISFDDPPALTAFYLTVFASITAKQVTGFEDRITVNVTQPVQDISVNVADTSDVILVSPQQDVITISTSVQSVPGVTIDVGVVDTQEQINVAVDTAAAAWGTIIGTLSTQTDLWKYLSAVGTSNFDIATLNNYLSTNNILLCSINVKDPIIYIAEDNQTDFLDIGIIASWTNPPGYPTGYQHGGLIRRSDNKTWTLFSGASSEPLSGLNVQWSQQGIVLEPLSANFYGDIYGNRNVFGKLNITNGLTVVGVISGNNTTTSFNTGSATGNLSFAVNNGDAYGQRSIAGGNNTIASGSNTVAFGSSSRATGTTSTAKGTSTQATNTNANAEGSSTIASGQASHAEGTSTIAGPGNNSHAEGLRTTASGAQSHAEGTDSQATASNAHAEGDFAQATGLRSHAEGLDTIASGSNSHAEGDATQATGINAHAEGFETIASGQHSHSENLRTQATGNMSHAGGRSSIAQGNISFVHGNESRATGEKSFAIGETVHAMGSSSIAMGVCAIAAHDNSFIWSGIGSPVVPISTTCVGQFYIKPDCGVYIDGDLTVTGTLNGTVAGSISSTRTVFASGLSINTSAASAVFVLQGRDTLSNKNTIFVDSINREILSFTNRGTLVITGRTNSNMLSLESDQSISPNLMRMQIPGSANYQYFGVGSNGYVFLNTSGNAASPMLTIENNEFGGQGRVGIGTGSGVPNEKLTVVGNISATGSGTFTNLSASGNITAPNQTASTGGSVLTRDLTDARYYPWSPAAHCFGSIGTAAVTNAALGPYMMQSRADSTFTFGWGTNNSPAYGLPFFCNNGKSLSTVRINHTAGTNSNASATLEVGLYAANSSGLPDTFIDKVAFSLSATGSKTATLAAPYTPTGLFWALVRPVSGDTDFKDVSKGGNGTSLTVMGYGNGYNLWAAQFFGFGVDSSGPTQYHGSLMPRRDSNSSLLPTSSVLSQIEVPQAANGGLPCVILY